MNVTLLPRPTVYRVYDCCKWIAAINVQCQMFSLCMVLRWTVAQWVKKERGRGENNVNNLTLSCETLSVMRS